jgi:hypothetical protein
MHVKAALRGVGQATLGRALADKEPLDLGALLGQACLIDVREGATPAGRKYAKIAAVTGLPRGVTAPAAIRPLLNWFIGDSLPDLEAAWPPRVFGRPVVEAVKEALDYDKAYPQAAGAPAGLANGEAF